MQMSSPDFPPNFLQKKIAKMLSRFPGIHLTPKQWNYGSRDRPIPAFPVANGHVTGHVTLCKNFLKHSFWVLHRPCSTLGVMQLVGLIQQISTENRSVAATWGTYGGRHFPAVSGRRKKIR